MNRLLALAGLALWAGTTLLLSGVRRLSRPSLGERLRPYHPGVTPLPRSRLAAGGSLRQLIGPVAGELAGRMAGLLGVAEDAGVRLRRIHSPLGPSSFRVRQTAWSGAALAGGLMVVTAASLPPEVGAFVVVGSPLLAFLVVEQRLANASARWQRRVLYELPVVGEQLAMLLAAGYSLGAAINRIAERGSGCCARDLATVANRLRQGVGEQAALGEWAEVAGVEGVSRLVAVLALNSEATDLARLVSVESRQARQEAHRRTLEVIERRSEQVWIPVTIATLVPGVILIAVPFLAALHTFSNA